jgi:hypothetical protein
MNKFEKKGVLFDCQGCLSPYAALVVTPFVSEGIRKPRKDWGEDEEGKAPLCHDCYVKIWNEV